MILPLLWLLLAPAPAGATSSGDEVKFGIDVAQKGLWQEARFRFEKAVELDPDNASALNNLAIALEQQGEFDKARERLREGPQAQARRRLHPAELRPVPGSR